MTFNITIIINNKDKGYTAKPLPKPRCLMNKDLNHEQRIIMNIICYYSNNLLSLFTRQLNTIVFKKIVDIYIFCVIVITESLSSTLIQNSGFKISDRKIIFLKLYKNRAKLWERCRFSILNCERDFTLIIIIFIWNQFYLFNHYF